LKEPNPQLSSELGSCYLGDHIGGICDLQRYKNNYNALNLITTALDRNAYDRVSHLETAYDVWFKLCNTYESSSEIKFLRRDTYNRQYQTFCLHTSIV
jgi:hypothetical protein